jgi:NhaA family Na+:H+ antiporter
MEVRREIHEGALATLRLAALPLAGAVGGVTLPALLYLALNDAPATRDGWAVGTATDIAFALGVLALLGRSIPTAIRIFLLSIAIIDDILAVLIIAAFYSDGLDYAGFLVAAAGVALVLGLQQLGIGSAWAYVAPGAIIWAGLLSTGAHPTLAGVVLGLLTPVRSLPSRERHADVAARALDEVQRQTTRGSHPHDLVEPLRRLRRAQRELVPPVVRVQMALHPWVAYGVVPLFALANAGVAIGGAGLATEGARTILVGVLLALVAGKPLGIALGSWVAVRAGCCVLPPGLSWSGVWLAGLLGGIGFTMAIFIATLAFPAEALLTAAKLGVLLASAIAATLGLAFGFALKSRSLRPQPVGRGLIEP